MGRKRTVIVGDETAEPKIKKASKSKEEKLRVPGLKGGEKVAIVEAEPIVEEEEPVIQEEPASAKATARQGKTQVKKQRGKKYLSVKMKIVPEQAYSLPEAINLLKETSFSKFDGKAEAHLLTAKKGVKGEVVLPHFESKAKRIEIASDETLKKIEAEKIDFDVLIATPAFMTKLVKYAKTLGPKGLMPNPKDGTISENPAEAAKKFEKASLNFKTEANAPLIHTVFGKVSQKENELEENLKALIEAVGIRNIKKAVIKATMGPAIKLDVSSIS